jgi:hypothetical protein
MFEKNKSIESFSKDLTNNNNGSKSFEYSLKSLENALIFKKKKYSDYKLEKLDELEQNISKCIQSMDYENALIHLKKLTFFEPNSMKILN